MILGIIFIGTSQPIKNLYKNSASIITGLKIDDNKKNPADNKEVNNINDCQKVTRDTTGLSQKKIFEITKLMKK